jgi:hypothetical protein
MSAEHVAPCNNAWPLWCDGCGFPIRVGCKDEDLPVIYCNRCYEARYVAFIRNDERPRDLRSRSEP